MAHRRYLGKRNSQGFGYSTKLDLKWKKSRLVCFETAWCGDAAQNGGEPWLG